MCLCLLRYNHITIEQNCAVEKSDSKFEQGHVSLFHTSFALKIENRAIPNSLYTLQKFNKSNALPCNEVYAMLQRGFLTL